MKKATTLEAAQEIYDEIEADVFKAANVDATDADDVTDFKDLVSSVKENREAAQKNATETLNKYADVAKTMEDLSAHDKGVIERLIADALESVNNAKTAQEVKAAEKVLQDLLVDGSYTELKAEVERQNRILGAQKDAYKILDAYEATLNGMTDYADKDKVRATIVEIRNKVMNAKEKEVIGDVTSSGITAGLVQDFINQIKTYYKDLIKPSDKKLIEDTLAEALATLETYKTGAYANEVVNPEADEEDQITIADKVNEYIEALQEQEEILLASPKTYSYKAIEDALEIDTKYLDDTIKEIKKAAETNREAYLEAYKAAMEELEVYAENAEVFDLTEEQLSYINSLINNTEGKIKEVNTAPEVVAAMTVFRNAVAEYYAEFDQHQIEEIKKLAVEKLESYKDLTDAIDDLVDDGITAVKAQTSVNGIQTKLQEALDTINAEIKANKLATAKVEARAKFYNFLEEVDTLDNYSDAVHDWAAEAIEKINDATNVRTVETVVARYMGFIETQLEEDGTSLKAEIKEAQEEAKEEIALYKELAEISEEDELLAAIEAYENSILGENATLNSIAKDLAALRDHIDTFENQIIAKKLDAIEYIKAIGTKYYVYTTAQYTPKYEYLAGYCADNAKQVLSYDLLTSEDTGDAYVRRTFEKAITAIKNATKETDIALKASRPEPETTSTLLLAQRNNIITAVNNLSDMKKVADGKKVDIIRYAGTKLLIDDLKTLSNLSELDTKLNSLDDETLKVFLQEFFSDYNEEIDSVQYDAYLANDAEVFDEIVTRAEKAIDQYVEYRKAEIKKEANANLSVKNMDAEVTKETPNGDGKVLGNVPITNYQRNIQVTPDENGVGIVTGTLGKVSGFAAYSSDPSEQEGWYVTLKIDSATAKSIVMTREDTSTTKSFEGGVILLTVRFADKAALDTTKLKVEFYDEAGVTKDNKTSKTPVQTITYDFSNLNLLSWGEFHPTNG